MIGEQREARGDREVGHVQLVTAQDALVDQRIDPVEHGRDRSEQRIQGVSVGMKEPPGRRGQEHAHRPGARQQRAEPPVRAAHVQGVEV